MLAEQGVASERVENEPEISQCLEVYVQGFGVLSGRRSMGFNGPNPISMEAITAYLTRFPAYNDLMFIKIIAAMDSRYLKQVTDGNNSTRSG